MNPKMSFPILFAALFAPWVVVAEGPCAFERVSGHVFVIHGAQPGCPVAEGHPLTNPAAVLTDAGVVLVDPGSGKAVTDLVLTRLGEVTDAPVVAVFNSHIHGLYWLGNATVAARYPGADIYAHARMIERLAAGEDQFWARAILGDPAAKTVAPNIALEGGEAVEIGGLTFRVHFPGHAHTDHDLMIEVVEDGLLFLGGEVVEPEVPSQGVPADADFRGQMAAIEYALDLPVSVFVPGRGLTGDSSLPKRGLAFLSDLYAGVERYYEEGLPDYEITGRLKADLAAYEAWYDFEALGAVISYIYQQVEFELF